MNRRGFFKTLATAAAGFAILPPATTYDRIWKPATKLVKCEFEHHLTTGSVQWHINPEWENAPYQMGWIVQPPGWSMEEYNNLDKARFFKKKDGQFVMVPRWIQQ